MTLKTNRYYSVDAFAGAGKTHAALEYAVKFARGMGQKFLIAQPSTALIEESYRKCQEFAKASGGKVKITRFHSELGGPFVVGSIVNHFKEADDGGEIVLITHSALFRVPYLHRSDTWTLIVDEIPQVDRCWGLKISQTHEILTDALMVRDCGALYYQLLASDQTKLKAFASNQHDDQIYNIFQEAARCILSKDWKVYVRKENWDRYRNGVAGKIPSDLDLFAMMQPSMFAGFHSVIVMGAMFDQSLMALDWMSKGVEFRRFDAIQDHVRYQWHENGDLITFLYVLDTDWSKRIRGQEVDGKSVMDYAVDAVKTEFGDREFLWIANRDIADLVFPNGIRLPNTPHGLNQYQHIDNVVFLSALNRTPIHYSFLGEQGLDPDWVKMATGCQMAYQAMMRSSVRDPANSSRKIIVVPDARTAEFLADVFPGCSVGPLGGGIAIKKTAPGRKPIKKEGMSAQARQVRRRIKERQGRIAALFAEAAEQDKSVTKPLYSSNFVTEIADTNPKAKKGCKTYTFYVFDSIYSAKATAGLSLSNDELIAQLRECHEWASTSKTANALISAAAFDPSKSPNTKRGIANIEYVNGIWLDNDDGDLPPEEFHRIHPDLKFVAFNTYSGGNRWRGFIPTTQAMTVDVHQQIMRDLIYVVEKAGYYSDKIASKREAEGKPAKRHGFDESKFVASSLFYLPGRAQDGTCFFTEFSGQELDPITWIENSIVDLTPKSKPKSPPIPPTPANSNQPPITWTGPDDCPLINQDRLAIYRATQVHSGERYNGIFSFAMSIIGRAQRLGYPITEFEVEQLLTQIDDSMGGYHQRQDRKRIPQAIKSAFMKIAS